MQLTFEVVRRDDGRLAFFHGDRFVCHAPAAWADLLATASEATPTRVVAGVDPGAPGTTLRRKKKLASGARVDPALLHRAQQLADQGQTAVEIADALQLTTSTIYGWKHRGHLVIKSRGQTGRPSKAAKLDVATTKRRTHGRPRKTSRGPTLADLDTDAPPAGARKRCPVCRVMTASRYCPNGHDIYLDTELADEPARVRRTPLLDDEDDADD